MASTHSALAQEEIVTIFVVGFPEDLKEREFINMFTFSQGFEAATLVKDSKTDALAASSLLSGKRIDAFVLKAELAKKNLFKSHEHALLPSDLLASDDDAFSLLYSHSQFESPFLSQLGDSLLSCNNSVRSSLPSRSSDASFLSVGSSRSIESDHVKSDEGFSRFGQDVGFLGIGSKMSSLMALDSEKEKERSQTPISSGGLLSPPITPVSSAYREAFSSSSLVASNTVTFQSPSYNPSSNYTPAPLSPDNYQHFQQLQQQLQQKHSVAPSQAFNTIQARDQNPPCNTLYVGNLPSSTNPEELEGIFSDCRGYKRLCFRMRSNGPMCFVEFEDVVCASVAMQDLYGHSLSTHTKGGGIRLSFSKNPLGVRLNNIVARGFFSA